MAFPLSGPRDVAGFASRERWTANGVPAAAQTRMRPRLPGPHPCLGIGRSIRRS